MRNEADITTEKDFQQGFLGEMAYFSARLPSEYLMREDLKTFKFSTEVTDFTLWGLIIGKLFLAEAVCVIFTISIFM